MTLRHGTRVPTTRRELRWVGRDVSDRNAPAHRPSDKAFYTGEVLVVPVTPGEAWEPGDLVQWAIVERTPRFDFGSRLEGSEPDLDIVTYEPRRYRVVSVNRVGREVPKAVLKAVPIDAGDRISP